MPASPLVPFRWNCNWYIIICEIVNLVSHLWAQRHIQPWVCRRLWPSMRTGRRNCACSESVTRGNCAASSFRKSETRWSPALSTRTRPCAGAYVYSNSKLERIFLTSNFFFSIFSNFSKNIFWTFQNYSLRNPRKFENQFSRTFSSFSYKFLKF